jgi:hypothetical protein
MFLKPRSHTRSLGWHIVHNLIAHPLLCLPQMFKWPDRFHDWTANKAYYFAPEIETSATLKSVDVWEQPDDRPHTTISC